MVMPAGVGDLQKGERYSNIDYIFASSMKLYVPKRLVISYDIACQWSRNFVSRCSTLPYHIRFDPASTSVEYVIPKFHIAAHGTSCRTRYSLNFLRHMGRTDGENIERGWAWMNPASLSTREMGPGSRADTLDDQWCSWNFRIRTRLGTTLYRRLDESVSMARLQRDTHTAFTKTFHPNAVAKWSAQVDAWCADPLNTRIENPFEEPAPTITMADIRRELNAEEAEELAKGVVPTHAVSASQYLVAGLQLEDQQRSLYLQHAVTKSSSTTRSLAIEDKESELRRKIAQWKLDIQPKYMPGIPVAPANDDLNDDGGGDHAGEVWEVPLCLPSSFSAEQRRTYCAPGVEEKERRLRFAQAEDALDELRRVLRAVLALDTHKGKQTAGSGVAANTRMQTLLSRHRAKQDRIAERYRAARKALCALDPVGASAKEGWGNRLKVLNKSHVTPPVAEDGQSEGRLELSWIWLTSSGKAHPLATIDSLPEGEYDDSLRTEWAKSLARAERWEEEVILIPIEMRRVLRNMVFGAREWRLNSQQAISSSSKSTRIQAGYAAYAEKQAYILEELAQDYATLWLSLFREYGIDTPSGWPHMCSVERPIKRRVERRRDRMKNRVQAHALAGGSVPSHAISVT
ncbi:hypothetical protein SCHPADRAFT_947170 [Schizopora paradoxa]|uniref:CxC2-like cysteine cluster KDZ transposase-associated domain-containing protein n=1 Tax=Schizopora paradoxa TaxID=27342 RepID=A0A0H2RJZ6_9AGAM|nr:hypothetical protein SCHPADRAFT_947170 [Schizopora paradoxa]